MAIISRSYHFDADDARLFELISDPGKAEKLLPGIHSIRNIEALPNGGVRCDLNVVSGPLDQAMHLETTEYDPPERLVRVSTGGAMTVIDTVTLDPDETGCTLNSRIELRIAIPLIGNLVAGILLKQYEQNLITGYHNLQKELAEEAG